MEIGLVQKSMIDLECMLSKFCKEYNIKRTVPIDVFAIATKCGFVVYPTEWEPGYNYEIDGILLVDDTVDRIDGYVGNHLIAYNLHRSFLRQKFIVGYAFMAYLLEKHKFGANGGPFKFGRRFTDKACPRSSVGFDEDDKISYLTKSLFLPKEVCAGVDIIDHNKIKDLAMVYEVSELMMEERVRDLKILNGDA